MPPSAAYRVRRVTLFVAAFVFHTLTIGAVGFAMAFAVAGLLLGD